VPPSPITRGYQLVTEDTAAEALSRDVVRKYWLLRLSTSTKSDRVRVAGWRIVAFHMFFPVAAILAGVTEKTLHLPRGGRGVLDHYGFHALFLSAPVLTWMLSSFVLRLVAVTAESSWFGGSNENPNAKSLQDELVGLLLARDPRGARILAQMRAVGVAAVFANASSTLYPRVVYGQDVFDSIYHPIGYVIGRLFLTYHWIYLLPVLIYFAGIATYATVRIAGLVANCGEEVLRSFAADGCGGFRALGSLMNAIVYMYLPIVGIIVALFHTHANSYPLLKLSIVLAIFIPAQLFLPILRLHRTMVVLKERKLSRIEKLLTSAERELPDELPRDRESRLVLPYVYEPRSWESNFAVPYLRLLAGASLYQQATGMTTWPYARKDALKWVTPFIPVAISTLVKKFVP